MAGAADSVSGTEGVVAAAATGAGAGVAGMTVASDPGNLTFTESSVGSSRESAVGCVTTFSVGADSATGAGAAGGCVAGLG